MTAISACSCRHSALTRPKFDSSAVMWSYFFEFSVSKETILSSSSTFFASELSKSFLTSSSCDSSFSFSFLSALCLSSYKVRKLRILRSCFSYSLFKSSESTLISLPVTAASISVIFCFS